MAPAVLQAGAIGAHHAGSDAARQRSPNAFPPHVRNRPAHVWPAWDRSEAWPLVLPEWASGLRRRDLGWGHRGTDRSVPGASSRAAGCGRLGSYRRTAPAQHRCPPASPTSPPRGPGTSTSPVGPRPTLIARSARCRLGTRGRRGRPSPRAASPVDLFAGQACHLGSPCRPRDVQPFTVVDPQRFKHAGMLGAEDVHHPTQWPSARKRPAMLLRRLTGGRGPTGQRLVRRRAPCGEPVASRGSGWRGGP
jgi:hypothetical protein